MRSIYMLSEGSCRDYFNAALELSVWVAGQNLSVRIHPLSWPIGYSLSASASRLYLGPISLAAHNTHVKEPPHA